MNLSYWWTLIFHLVAMNSFRPLLIVLVSFEVLEQTCEKWLVVFLHIFQLVKLRQLFEALQLACIEVILSRLIEDELSTLQVLYFINVANSQSWVDTLGFGSSRAYWNVDKLVCKFNSDAAWFHK